MAEKSGKTVVIFPVMAEGHLIPFLALARKMEERYGYDIVFVNTPLNIQKLQSSLSTDTSIRLAELPFCSADHNLPPNTENSHMLPGELIPRLLKASQSLQTPLEHLLSEITERDGQPPLCIISDMFMGWTVDVANKLGIFHSVFISGGSYGMATFFSLSLNLSKFQLGDDEFSLPDFPEAPRMHSSQVPDEFKNGTENWGFCEQQLSRCLCSDALLLNTIEGLENSGLSYFIRKTGGRPVWPIGPICTLPKDSEYRGKDQITVITPMNYSYSEWLQLHPPASVLYVSFGSQGIISASQMKELALGLEASGKPFIWVIRPPKEFAVMEEFSADWLPSRFEERIRKGNQGFLIYRWAPQLEILSHRSTGAFLSHCGWSSVLESLINAVPIIGWPLAGEQFSNSQMLEKERGVCIEVARGPTSEIKHDHIAEVIKMVMSGTEKREDMMKKACRIQAMMNDAVAEGEGFKGSSLGSLDDFISTAVSWRSSHTKSPY